ncbi:MAG: hypothetical protein A2Z72_04155 [Omnitrophica bacterium RBG_13_46_9]|nr:MAG: hypothetical protein A2Z72_04155 [Omnitrophica bacterium RBG_13_46_9]
MRPENGKYIEANIGKKSVSQISKELGLKEKKIRRYLEEKKQTHTGKDAEAKIQPVRRKTKVISFLLLVGIVAAVYANSLGGPFLFDDKTLVESNPLIRTISNVPFFFKTDIFAHDLEKEPLSNSYRPIQTITYALDFLLWGNDSRGFHLTNILIHIFNILLVFLLIRKLFNDVYLAYFVSLLFGINPANTACVSYVSGRADILVAAFMLLAIMFYVSYSRNGGWVFLLFSVLSYLFAVYSKEYAIVTLPLVLFIYNAVFDRKNIFKIKSYIFYVLPLLCYFPLRMSAFKGVATRSLELSKISLLPRLMTSLKTLFIDIRIIFLPYDLHFGRTTDIEYSIFGSLYSILTVLGLILALYVLKTSYKSWISGKKAQSGILFFGISWFTVSMIPLLNIFPLQVFNADNWLYFSSIGAYLVFSSIIVHVWRLIYKKKMFFRDAFSFSIVLMFIVYGYGTVQRNRDYQSEIKFYLSSVKWRPNIKFYRVIGAIYGQKGDYGNAVKYLEKAVETNRIYPSPEITEVYYVLGVTYMRLSEYTKAEENFKKVLASDSEALKTEAQKQLLYIKQRQ